MSCPPAHALLDSRRRCVGALWLRARTLLLGAALAVAPVCSSCRACNPPRCRVFVVGPLAGAVLAVPFFYFVSQPWELKRDAKGQVVEQDDGGMKITSDV